MSVLFLNLFVTFQMMLSFEDYMIPCLNKKIFGFECLGCGFQRALSLLFQGELIAAFKMYPAIYTLIPLFILVGINFFYKFITNSSENSDPRKIRKFLRNLWRSGKLGKFC